MRINYPECNPIFPLIYDLQDKKGAIKIIKNAGIEPPDAYKRGYSNNNCHGTGCVQGGIGYWQKIQREEPEKFLAMAEREHRYTDKKGQPVTICKDQSTKPAQLVFLLPHPQYPLHKDISMMKGREPEPLMECNGFCGLSDGHPAATLPVFNNL